MCSLFVSYNRYHSVPKTFICCCSGRDSCMLTSRCMLPSLRSAPYPALCPCEPLGPVGDLQAVSYGARSRQYSPLLPAPAPHTHHDIVKQYRKGLTAAVDRCVDYIYPRIMPMIPLCSEKFYLLLFWSRLVHADLAMHATPAALGTLPRSMSL